MTSVTALSSSKINNYSNSFCNRSFQLLRTLVAVVKKFCIAIFHKMILCFMWVARKRPSAIFYNSVSTSNNARITPQAVYKVPLNRNERVKYESSELLPTIRRIAAYIPSFLPKIPFPLITPFSFIDYPAINSSSKIKVISSNNKIALLKQIYGDRTIDEWLTLKSSDFKIDRDQLVISSDGMCFGMSLDFISLYLKAIQAGQGSIEAVAGIAPLYEKGATDPATITQIFYQSLKYSDQSSMEIGQRFQLNKIGIERAVHKFELRRKQPIFTKLGFSVEMRKTISSAQINEIDWRKLSDELAEGAYQAVIANNVGAGLHAITYIRKDNQCFIFDPNIGTVSASREAAGTQLGALFQAYFDCYKFGRTGFVYLARIALRKDT